MQIILYRANSILNKTKPFNDFFLISDKYTKERLITMRRRRIINREIMGFGGLNPLPPEANGVVGAKHPETR